MPHALLHNLKHNQVLHQRIVVLKVEGADVPRVMPAERLQVTPLGEVLCRVVARHCFMEEPDVPEYLKLLTYQHGIPIEAMSTSFFTSRETVSARHLQAMTRVRRAVFVWLHRNSSRSSDYFRLPENRVVEFGRRP